MSVKRRIGVYLFSKNAILRLSLGLGLGLGLGLVSTLTLTLKQHSLKKKIDLDPAFY